jgi:hypothetical protein
MAWGARKPLRAGPYFRNYSVSAKRGRGVKAGWRSQGFAFGNPDRLPGRFTINLTRGKWSWNHPGPGAFTDLNIPAWALAALPRWLTRKPGEDA